MRLWGGRRLSLWLGLGFWLLKLRLLLQSRRLWSLWLNEWLSFWFQRRLWLRRRRRVFWLLRN